MRRTRLRKHFIGLGLLLCGPLPGLIELIFEAAALLFELRDACLVLLVALGRRFAIALKAAEPLAQRGELALGVDNLLIEIGPLARGGEVLLAQVNELLVAFRDLIAKVEALLILFIELFTEIEDLAARCARS